jgi:hypothetical protein
VSLVERRAVSLVERRAVSLVEWRVGKPLWTSASRQPCSQRRRKPFVEKCPTGQFITHRDDLLRTRIGLDDGGDDAPALIIPQNKKGGEGQGFGDGLPH